MMFTNKEIVSKKVCSHAGNERYTSSMMETGAAELLWLLSKVLQRSFKCNKTVGRRKKQPKKHDIHFLSQEEDHHQEEWRVKKHLLLWSRTFSGESAILSVFMVIHKFLIFSCIRTTIYKSLVQKYKKIISLQKISIRKSSRFTHDILLSNHDFNNHLSLVVMYETTKSVDATLRPREQSLNNKDWTRASVSPSFFCTNNNRYQKEKHWCCNENWHV